MGAAGEPVPLAPAALEGVTHILNSIPPDRQGEDAVALALLPQLEKLNLHWFGYLSTTGSMAIAKGAG